MAGEDEKSKFPSNSIFLQPEENNLNGQKLILDNMSLNYATPENNINSVLAVAS